MSIAQARAELLAIVRRYAPVAHIVSQDGLAALNAAMDKLQAAAIADLKVPGLPPALPGGATTPVRAVEDIARELAFHPHADVVVETAKQMAFDAATKSITHDLRIGGPDDIPADIAEAACHPGAEGADLNSPPETGEVPAGTDRAADEPNGAGAHRLDAGAKLL